jgi:glutaredoxin
VNIELTLLGKPGCHLCDDARAAIQEVLADFQIANPAAVVSVIEKNILDDEALRIKYFEEIPVLLIDGKVHNYWRIDKTRLAKALDASISRPRFLKNNRCVS